LTESTAIDAFATSTIDAIADMSSANADRVLVQLCHRWWWWIIVQFDMVVECITAHCTVGAHGAGKLSSAFVHTFVCTHIPMHFGTIGTRWAYDNTFSRFSVSIVHQSMMVET
jgi:hypothetical protein